MRDIGSLFLLVYLSCALVRFAVERIGVYVTNHYAPAVPTPSSLELLWHALRDPWKVFLFAKFFYLSFLARLHGSTTVRGEDIAMQVDLKRRTEMKIAHCSCDCASCVDCSIKARARKHPSSPA